MNYLEDNYKPVKQEKTIPLDQIIEVAKIINKSNYSLDLLIKTIEVG